MSLNSKSSAGIHTIVILIVIYPTLPPSPLFGLKNILFALMSWDETI